MKVLVTGASGFLGKRLSLYLQQKGLEVWGTSRSAEKLTFLIESQRFRADLSQSGGVEEVCRLIHREGFDAIIHCAALCKTWGDEAVIYKTNVVASVALFRQCQESGVPHFLQISSPSVFAALEHRLLLTESDCFASPLNAYAGSKQELERQLCSMNSRGETALSILRPQAMFGVGDPHLLPKLIRLSRYQGVPLIREGEHFIDITPVDNVVAAIDAILCEKGRGEVQLYNFSEPSVMNFKAQLEAVFMACGEPIRWREVSLSTARLVAHVLEGGARLMHRSQEPKLTKYKLSVLAYSRTLDSSKLSRLPGYIPVISMEETLNQIRYNYNQR